MFADYQQQQAAQARAKEEEALAAFLTEYPDLNSQSVLGVLIKYHRSNNIPITLEELKSSALALAEAGIILMKSEAQVEEDAKEFAQQQEQEAKAERERLLGEIKARLLANLPVSADSYARAGHVVSVDRQISNVFAFKSNHELAQDLHEMDEKKRLRGMSAADLRKVVSRGNAQPPVLPSEYTREVLNDLLKNNVGEIRRLMKLYGSEAIDVRRGYTSAVAPGIAVRLPLW